MNKLLVVKNQWKKSSILINKMNNNNNSQLIKVEASQDFILYIYADGQVVRYLNLLDDPRLNPL